MLVRGGTAALLEGDEIELLEVLACRLLREVRALEEHRLSGEQRRCGTASVWPQRREIPLDRGRAGIRVRVRDVTADECGFSGLDVLGFATCDRHLVGTRQGVYEASDVKVRDRARRGLGHVQEVDVEGAIRERRQRSFGQLGARLALRGRSGVHRRAGWRRRGRRGTGRCRAGRRCGACGRDQGAGKSQRECGAPGHQSSWGPERSAEHTPLERRFRPVPLHDRQGWPRSLGTTFA